MKSVYDYGVLMVHGIGESRRAETLVRFSEPLISAIQEIVGGGSAPKKTVRAADLYGKGSPAHAEVEFSGTRPKDGKEFNEKWLFAEAWWAESFPTPTWKEITSWAKQIIPSTLVAHFEARFRRQGYDFDQWRSKTWRQRGVLASRWVGESLWLLLGLLLVPILLFAVIATLLLGVIPDKAVRNFVGKLQRKLSATLGDSYVFMGREISAASIVGTVEKDFHWLSTQCRSVAVIAHSQGAAVSHRALRNRPLRPTDLFVTLGSGLRKLTEIEALRANPALAQARGTIWAASGAALVAGLGTVSWILWSGYGELWRRLFVAGLTVFATILLGSVMILIRPEKGSSGADTRNRRWLLVFLAACGGLAWWASSVVHPASPWQGGVSTFLVAGGLATAFTSLIRWRRQTGRSTHEAKQANIERELFRQRYRFATSGLEWWDFYASDDPVSNGPLLDSRYLPDHFHSIEIRNLDSILRDHTTYWKNLDGFVRPLARRLLAKREVCWPNSDEDFVATRRRRWRVRWLVWARRTLATLAVGLFLLATAQDRPWSAEIVERYESAQAAAAAATDAEAGVVAGAEVNAKVDDVADDETGDKPDGKLKKPVTLAAVLFGDASFKDYLLEGADGHPHLTAAVLALLYWALAYGVLVFFWGLWNAKETQGVAEYEFASLRFFGYLGAFAVSSGFAFVLATGDGNAVSAGVPLVFLWIAVLAPVGEYGTVDEIVRSRIAARKQRLEIASSNPIDIGWQLYDQGAVEEALETWEKAWHEDQNAEAAYLVSRYLEPGPKADDAVVEAVNMKVRDAAEFGDWMEHPWAAMRLAELSMEEGEYDVAVEYYQRTQKLLVSPDSGALSPSDVAWMNIPMADALAAAGKEDEATDLLIQDMKSGNGYAAWKLGHKLVSRENPTPEELEKAVDYFGQALQLGDSSAAIAMSKAFVKLDDVSRARDVLQIGADLGAPGCYQELGELELEQEGDADAAFEAFKKERDRNPDSFEAAKSLYKLGQIQEKRGRLPAAKRFYRKALAHKEGAHRPAATALGKLLEAEYDLDGAEAAFEKGVELDEWGGSRELLAFMARRWQFDEILERVRQAVRENRRDWGSGVANVGEHFEKNYTKGAVEIYEAALTLGAGHAAELGFRFLVKQWDTKKALQWARDKKPEDPHSLAELASQFPFQSDESRELYALAASQGDVDSVITLVKWDGSDQDRKERLKAWLAEHAEKAELLVATLRVEGEEELADFVEQVG